MARSESQVLDELLTLTPPGWALPHDPASVWASFLAPWANEASLIESTAEGLLLELDPRTCVNLLPDYERCLGPDPYGRDATGNDLTTTQLATLAYERWTERGNANPADFVALAAQSGIAITVTTYTPFVCGATPIGTIGLVQTPFEWTVNVALADLLAVEALILGEAPAHTWPSFNTA